MNVVFRHESKYQEFRCLSGCKRDVYAYTQFRDHPSNWTEYCDECMRDKPLVGANMYIEISTAYGVYCVYNIDYCRQSTDLSHDFRLCKI